LFGSSHCVVFCLLNIHMYIFVQGFITCVGTYTNVFLQDSAIPLLDRSDFQRHLMCAVRTPGYYPVQFRAPLPFGQGPDTPRVHTFTALFPFRGSFAKLRKATINFVMCVCVRLSMRRSVRPYVTTRLPLEGFA
jgi:hypothetical protein